MVGGKVIGIARTEGEPTLLHVEDRHEYKNGHVFTDRCCIRVHEGDERIRLGDSTWWQGRYVMWTPQPYDGREDIKLERASYSFSHPDGQEGR